MASNRRTSEFDGKTYTYTLPSPKSYPFQWFWDSCFHAIILARLGEMGKAKAEIESLLSHQEKDGFMAHIIFWDPSKLELFPWQWNWLETKPFSSFLPGFPKPKISGEIQPPVIAQAVKTIYQADGDKNWVKKIFPRLLLYYRWLEENRDPDYDSLITIIAPFESGVDQSPAYDPILGLPQTPTRKEILRKDRTLSLVNKLFGYRSLLNTFGPFQVEDVLVNSIYAQGLSALALLAKAVGEETTANVLAGKSGKVLKALIAKCFDQEEGMFFNLDGKAEKQAKTKTVLSLMPLILPKLPKEIVKRLVNHLTNPEEFYLPFPIPSTAKDEPAFNLETDLLWRGTTWVCTNWFLVHGLEAHGYEKLAGEIAEKTKKLVLQHGFREYYNPVSGEPGATAAFDFGWSALVVDL